MYNQTNIIYNILNFISNILSFQLNAEDSIKKVFGDFSHVQIMFFKIPYSVSVYHLLNCVHTLLLYLEPKCDKNITFMNRQTDKEN